MSGVGALGCKVNPNMVAYQPGPVNCDNICVQVSYQGRSVVLLNVGQPQVNFGVSYDAWNYLGFGVSAYMSAQPAAVLPMSWDYVSNELCRGLMYQGQLPLGVGAGSGFAQYCTANQPNSWVANNHMIWNLSDSCGQGHDEVCDMAWGTNNPTCPHPAYSQDATGIAFYTVKLGGAVMQG